MIEPYLIDLKGIDFELVRMLLPITGKSNVFYFAIFKLLEDKVLNRE